MDYNINFIDLNKSKRKLQVKKIRDYLKKSFDFGNFKYLSEVFFHVGVAKYDYKLIITRRAYLLYKLFEEIFEYFPEEIESFSAGSQWVSIGKFYNSHSMYLLRPVFEKENFDKKLLVVDDIIVHGRSVSQICDDLVDAISVPKNNLYFWCVYRNFNAKCITDDVSNRLMVYKTVSEQSWKNASNVFTKAIVDSGLGYTSYINTYLYRNFDQNWWERFLQEEDCGYRIIKLDQRELYSEQEPWIKENYDLHPYIYIEDNAFDEELNCCECLRFYVQGVDLLIVPYLFVSSVYSDEVYDYVLALLKKYKIVDIPSQFERKSIENDVDLTIIFLKWAINCIGKTMVNSFFRKIQAIDLEEIRHAESFGLDNSNQCYVKLNKQINPKRDLRSFKAVLPNPEMKYCRSKFESAIQEINSTGKLSERGPDLKELNKICVQYSFSIKEEDETRARDTDGKKRCCGIRLADAYEAIISAYQIINEQDKRTAFCNLLSLFILQWDTGEAAYNLFCVKQSEEGSFISGLMRNGEQVYRQIYRLYPNVYPYFNCFTHRVLEYRKEELSKFGDYLRNEFVQNKRSDLAKEVTDFQRVLALNSSYFDDAFVIYSQCNNKTVSDTVEKYIGCEYGS